MSNRKSKKFSRRRRTFSRKNMIKMKGGQISTPVFSFISYGNDRFKQSRERIRKEAEQMGCFDGQIKIYTPEDLSEDFKMAVGDVLKEMNGGGYMVWKPYIIMDMLSKLKDNDILLYADAGCTLNPGGVPRLNEYKEMISLNSNKSVLAMRGLNNYSSTLGSEPFLEKKWTATPVFEYFNESLDGKIANSPQLASGFLMCRKSPQSLEVIGKWLEVAKTRPDLFTDRYYEVSKTSNKYHIANRHDQSILSMIVKSEQYGKNCVIIDEEIEGRFGTPNDKRVKKINPVYASRIKI